MIPTFEFSSISMNDLDTLRDISIKTFSSTFASVNSPQNMKDYIGKNFSEEKLRSELNDKNAAFYFAKHEGNTIGYLKLNFDDAQTELKEKDAVEVERIYVLKEYHGKKAGQFLLNKTIEIAQKRAAQYIWLGVWEHNARAIAFYQKNGFVVFDSHRFQLGEDVQTDLIMKKVLK